MKSFLSLLFLWIVLSKLIVAQTVTNHVIENGTLKLKTESGIIAITPYAPNILRISISEKGEVENTDAIKIKRNSNAISFLIIDSLSAENLLLLTTDSLSLKIHLTPFQIEFYNKKGKQVAVQSKFLKADKHNGFCMKLQANEMIFGGGEGAIPLNRRGYRLNLNNEPHWGYGWGEENLNYSVPHFISSENYSVYFDNGAIGYADMGKTDSSQLEIASVGDNNTYFFIYNSTQKYLQASFAQLVGTQPMPPRWAFGNLMSRFGYQTEKEAREKLDSMLAAGYPVDAIILDLYWFGLGPDGWMMGDLDWYKPNWPTPEKMISDFQTKGVQTILITEPYVLETSKNFVEADKQGFFAKDSLGKTNIVKDFFFGRAGLIDLFNPKACDWYWKFYKKQIDNGVAGWWGDLGEPEKFHDDLVFSNGDGPDVRNLYGHYWSKMLADKYAENYPDKRLFHLNRAGFAGSQRYSSFPWSGDVSRTWGGFQAQLPNLLSMSMSNVPYTHSDLGGFCATDKNEELYLRWLQFGVFNPIFRPHSEKVPSEAIYYSDSIQKWVKPYFELRYKFLPYNYTLAWKQEQFGEPLATPLFMLNDIPKSMMGIYDEYMWGEAFLVAPVLEANQKVKDIFLPNGVWFDFFTDERYRGNSQFIKAITLESIPVFVKAGSFVAMSKPMQSTAFYQPDTLYLHYYYDETVSNSKGIIYDDDGKERNAYQKQHYETIQFQFSRSGDSLLFHFTNQGFEYPNRPESRTLILEIHNLPNDYKQNIRYIHLRKNESMNLEIVKSE